MEAMDELYQRYSQYVAELRKSAEHLNSLYPKPSRLPSSMLSRGDFQQYLMETPSTQTKRQFVLRIVDGDVELLARLPASLQQLAKRCAA